MSTRPRLSTLGYCLTAALSTALILAGGYVGWFYGAVWGLSKADPILNAPSPPGPGLAPNLTPLVDATFEVVASMAIGVVAGLLIAALLTWFVVGYLIVPLWARVPYLRREDEHVKG